MTAFDLAETDRLLTTTRSVRRRLDFDRPVERDVLLECVRISQQAPTGGNAQGWRWIFVTDPDRKRALADLYRRGGGEYLQPRDLSGVDPATRRIAESAIHLAQNMERSPVLALPCINRPSVDASLPHLTGSLGSIFPAIWSFQLALRARGLGSCITNLHLFCEEETVKVLDLPERMLNVALLPVAYTIGTDFKPARRPDPESIVRWEEWSD